MSNNILAPKPADAVVCTCTKCTGTGRYIVPTQQGGIKDLGPCFACLGKGKQTQGDINRTNAYWNWRGGQAVKADEAQVKVPLQTVVAKAVAEPVKAVSTEPAKKVVKKATKKASSAK